MATVIDPATPPTVIGDYRLLRVLGRGGMGTVYLADDPLLARQVAVKVVDGLRDHPSARARFLVEARAIGRLNHPNVVTVHRAGEHGGEPYLVSEFVDGERLDRLARPIAPARLAAIALGLARGLAAAHREGIHHRDVKPSNAIVARDGTVKLLDFGLARLGGDGVTSAARGSSPAVRPVAAEGSGRVARDPAADPDATPTFTPPAPREGATPPSGLAAAELTLAGSRLGTPRYMAPEAWRGERLTAAADVFSLGLVLWELFAGRHPLADVDSADLPAAAGRVPSLASVAGAASPAVVEVIDRALAAAPADRHPDAGALVVALERALVAAPPAGGGAVAAGAIVVGALATGALALLLAPGHDGARDHDLGPAAVAAVAAGSTGGSTGAAPTDVAASARALTALGGCASDPAFVDGATIVFGFRRGEVADVRTVVPPAAPVVIADLLDWDWQPERGRHPGEVLFVADGADGRPRIEALSRASGGVSEVAVGYTAVAIGDAVFYATDDDLGWIHRRDRAGDQRFVAIAGPLSQLAVAPDGRRLAAVMTDPDTLPSLCVVDVATRAVRCPTTTRMQNGRPAFAPRGDVIYYPSATGLRALDLATADDRLVAADVAARSGLAISGDGRRMIYADCRSYGSIVATGAGRIEVLLDHARVRNPVAGPGGGLAYVEAVDGGGTRIVLDDRGRDPGRSRRVLATGPGELGRPAFTADGRQVAYVYADPGVIGQARIVVRAVDGEGVVSWTHGASDRDPIWLADGGLAFTRFAPDGRPAVWRQDRADGAPRRLLADASVQDRSGDRLLVLRGGATLAWVELATGRVTPVPTAGVRGQTITAARVLPDGALVIAVAEDSALLRLAPTTGATAVLQRHPGGETIGAPAVLADGRVVYRAEIWLGELYERGGAW